MDDTGELERILTEHYRRYPRMQVQDAVKLIYQNEFGGGHLVSDREGSLARLRDEYASVTGRDSELSVGKGDHAAVPLFEDIGNGLCRINLAGLGRYPVSLETVNNFFIHTANTHRGGIRS